MHTLCDAMKNPPIILVTGASRGLGKGIAIGLAGAGYSVAIHYSASVEAAHDTLEQCRAVADSAGQRFALVKADLSLPAERLTILPQTLDAFGHIDGLINNAGITEPGRADILEATEEAYDYVTEVNLKSPYFLTQETARYWIDNPKKRRLSTGYKVIFITSVSADTVSLNRGGYCISKAGLWMAGQLWAARLAEYGIQVIELRPGIMDTDMAANAKEKYDNLIAGGLVPQRRWGQPEDVGKPVLSILRGDFAFATGAVVTIDGGLGIKRL